MIGDERATRALISHAAGLDTLRRAAHILGHAGIALMPLKGIWLQVCVYRDAAARTITDVDVLVGESDYARAIAVLAAAGWHPDARNASETSLTHPACMLPLDLHRRLFLPGAFRLPTRELFARARGDRTSFQVELLLPDPLDVFAHLVGHFVKSRTPHDDHERLSDFVAIAERFSVDPRLCASHLHASGLARAARYVLAIVAEHLGDPFCHSVIASLPSDQVGVSLAWCARRVTAALAPDAPLCALLGFVLEPSLAAGSVAFARRALERARART